MSSLLTAEKTKQKESLKMGLTKNKVRAKRLAISNSSWMLENSTKMLTHRNTRDNTKRKRTKRTVAKKKNNKKPKFRWKRISNGRDVDDTTPKTYKVLNRLQQMYNVCSSTEQQAINEQPFNSLKNGN